jgi:hypothetical protein
MTSLALRRSSKSRGNDPLPEPQSAAWMLLSEGPEGPGVPGISHNGASRSRAPLEMLNTQTASLGAHLRTRRPVTSRPQPFLPFKTRQLS